MAAVLTCTDPKSCALNNEEFAYKCLEFGEETKRFVYRCTACDLFVISDPMQLTGEQTLICIRRGEKTYQCRVGAKPKIDGGISTSGHKCYLDDENLAAAIMLAAKGKDSIFRYRCHRCNVLVIGHIAPNRTADAYVKRSKTQYMLCFR